jgi:hypothetical protein
MTLPFLVPPPSIREGSAAIGKTKAARGRQKRLNFIIPSSLVIRRASGYQAWPYANWSGETYGFHAACA